MFGSGGVEERLFWSEGLDPRASGAAAAAGGGLWPDPPWLRRAVRIMIAASVAAIVFLFVVSVDEYATGRAFVRDDRLVTLVAADYRPMLGPGLPMRFELDDFREEHAGGVNAEVSSLAVEPAEIARLLGDGARSHEIVGKVLVTATLPAAALPPEAQARGSRDALRGRAEIRIRHESLLVTLVPELRRVLR